MSDLEARPPRQPGGRFAPGNPGKPQGARHRTTRAIAEMLDGDSEAITRAAIDKAKAGDTTALRLCLERLYPAGKDSPVAFHLPPINTVADAEKASSAVLAAVAAGELTPGEGASVMNLLVAHKSIVEAGDHERRLAELEARATK
jgi:hypothetical protein